MKNRILLAALLLFSSLAFTSCSKDQTDYSDTTAEILTQGSWTVAYYYDGGDRTSQLSPYAFTFRGNGTVEGCNGASTVTGQWEFLRDGQRNDLVRVRFNSTEPYLTELTNDWRVTDKNLDQLQLITPGNATLRIRKR